MAQPSCFEVFSTYLCFNENLCNIEHNEDIDGEVDIWLLETREHKGRIQMQTEAENQLKSL